MFACNDGQLKAESPFAGTMVKLGERMLAAREAAGLDIPAVATGTGLDLRLIGALESGRCCADRVELDEVGLIADFLRVPIDQLFR